MYTLSVIESIRKKAIDLITNTSSDVLNTIPEGFNNNIIWNFGHLIVSGYSLVFKATKVDPDMVVPLQEKFRKGSKPEGLVTQEEINELIKMANQFTETIRIAIKADRFNDVSPYTTETFGIEITSIEEMFITVTIHDAIHFQSMKDIKRILTK